MSSWPRSEVTPANTTVPISSPVSGTGRARRIRGLLTHNKPSRLTKAHHDAVTKAKTLVAWFHRETGLDLTDRCRCDEHVRARAVVAMLLHKRGLSFPAIGVALCRDHSTVMSALHKGDVNMRAAAAALEREYAAVESGAAR